MLLKKVQVEELVWVLVVQELRDQVMSVESWQAVMKHVAIQLTYHVLNILYNWITQDPQAPSHRHWFHHQDHLPNQEVLLDQLNSVQTYAILYRISQSKIKNL